MNWNLVLLKLSTQKNVIVGLIYRHPFMDLTGFNCNYLIISLKNKNLFSYLEILINVNLLNYTGRNQTNEFLYL